MNVKEKLVELLREVQYLGGLEEKIADHLIANGVTVQEWIPVTERLPEAGKYVLAYGEDDGVSIVYHGGDSYCYALVTHWMPLPEPPKEDAK